MGLKVAIVGLSASTHDQAPWSDDSWEKWGLPWDDNGWASMSRTFEMHDMRLLKSEHCKRKDGYFDRLQQCNNLFMQESCDYASRYPFEEVAASIGISYWNSSIAYAMAMAIHENAEEIGIFGVDMTGGDEYAYQRPNMEYLIGFARGKGIKVHIPQESALCKFVGTGILFYKHAPTYVDRYGWLG